MPFVYEAGQGPTLLFLHGWTMNGSLFQNQFARLSDRFHCIAPDLPGHGRASALPATLAQAARLVDRLCTARDLERVVLVGWSMGAAVSWTYLQQFGAARIAGLITVDMSPKIVNGEDWRLGLRDQTEKSTKGHTQRFQQDWQKSAVSIVAGMFAEQPGPPDFDCDRALAQVRSCDPAAMNRMWASLIASDTRDVIPALPVPVLACLGAKSRVYPARTARWIAETAPRGRIHAFAHSGHSPHLEQPEEFSQVVAKFTEEVSGVYDS